MTNATTTISPVVVALDVANLQELDDLLGKLDPSQCRLKVGKELFTRFGPDILRHIHQHGFEVFLDLKFHDIPNTVAAAVRAAAELGVWMVNVHASGGEKMMRAAREALDEFGSSAPLLIAVTILTSMSDEELPSLGLKAETAKEQVLLLAKLAQKSGMDGVVCSAQEAELLRQELGSDFTLVTPGIRPANAAADDQTRIVSPAQAVELGSNYLVIGRPITRSEHPSKALQEINLSLGI